MPQHKTKILLLWDRMGDYHRARWHALSKLIGEDCCFAADLGAGDKLYKWGNTEDNTQYFRLSDSPVEEVKAGEALHTFKKIIRENGITHVCIPGYGRMVYIRMLLWCRRKNIKVLMFAESWYPGNTLTDKLKGLLIRYTADVCFVSGKKAASHFVKNLNYPASKIIEGYSVVDNDHFASSPSKKTTPPQLLCVARFAEVKNLELLIDAFLSSTLADSWQLKIVGGGPLKHQLEEKAKGHPIILSDWLSYAELPEMYAQASCFILPSTFEPWGLVVNEAMAAGLPLILSDAVGTFPDLLMENKNGWLFPASKKLALIDILDKLSTLDPTELEEMGQQSRKIVSHFTPDTWAKKVMESFERC